MVNKLSLIIIFISCLVFNNRAIAVPQTPFEIVITEKSVVYGKSFNLKIKIRKSSEINLPILLKPLDEKFNYETSIFDENNSHFEYIIKLRPTEIGSIIIPSLKWNDFISQSTSIHVKPALSNNNGLIKVAIGKINTTPWVREQVIIRASILTDDKNIVLERKNLREKGIDSYLIPQSTSIIQSNKQTKYRHTIGWSIFFLYTQNKSLQLPEIEYLKDSIPKYKFNLRKVNISVKKLPIYISPIIPIGEVSLKSQYLSQSSFMTKPNKTSIIQYQLVGSGIPAKWLPSISQRYNLNNQLTIQYSHIKTALNNKLEPNGLVGQKTVDIAFTPLNNGRVAIENLNFQYFDPKLGMLKTLTYKPKTLISLNWFIQIFLLIAIIYISLLGFVKLINIVKRKLISLKQLSLAKKLLLNASKPTDIILALQQFSLSEGWPTNLSLNQWGLRFNKKYVDIYCLNDSIRMLNQDLYSKEDIRINNCDVIKDNLLNAINNLKKKPINFRRKIRLVDEYRQY